MHMRGKPKSMIVPLLAGLALTAGLGACGAPPRNSAAGPWRWSAPVTLEAGNAGNTTAVIAPPGRWGDAARYALGGERAPEYDRRDEALGVEQGDITDSWYAWPADPRPSLDNQRSFRTSRDPDRYNYPSTEPYGRVYPRYPVRRSPVYPRSPRHPSHGYPPHYWRDR